MKKFKELLFITIGLTILAAIPLGLFFLGKTFLGYLSVIDKTISASIIAASATTFAAVFTVMIGQNINKKREIENPHREYKIKLYSIFIDFTINWAFKNSESNKNKNESKLQKELETFLIDFSK